MLLPLAASWPLTSLYIANVLQHDNITSNYIKKKTKKHSMLWIVKSSLQRGIGYDPQGSMSRFIFVCASFLMLALSLFPHSKKFNSSFHAWKKDADGRKMSNRSSILDDNVEITALRIWLFRPYCCLMWLFVCSLETNLYTKKKKQYFFEETEEIIALVTFNL